MEPLLLKDNKCGMLGKYKIQVCCWYQVNVQDNSPAVLVIFIIISKYLLLTNFSIH